MSTVFLFRPDLLFSYSSFVENLIQTLHIPLFIPYFLFLVFMLFSFIRLALGKTKTITNNRYICYKIGFSNRYSVKLARYHLTVLK